MADTVTVRIVADASQLKTESAAAANAVKDLGGTAEEGSRKIEKIESAFAHVSGHITGHALGMGRMARSITSVGEAAIGLGPFLAVMIPVAALIAGIEIMHKLEEAALKVQKGFTEEAVETTKLTDELLKQREAYAGLVGGPLAEAILKSKDFAEEESKLTSIMSSFDKTLETHTSTWKAYVSIVQHYTDVVVAGLTSGTAGAAIALSSGGMSNAELATKVSRIEELYHQNKNLATAMQELQKIANELSLAGDPRSLAQLDALAVKMRQLGIAAQTSAQEQKNRDAETYKAWAEENNKRVEEHMKMLRGELDEAERQAKEKLKIAEKEAKENAEFEKNIKKEEAAAVVGIWEDAAKRQAEITKDSSKQSELAMEAAKAKGAEGRGLGPGPVSTVFNLESLAAQMQVAQNAMNQSKAEANKLKETIDALNISMLAVDPNSEEYTKLLGTLNNLRAQYDQATEAVDRWALKTQEIATEQKNNTLNFTRSWQDAVNKTTDAFNAGFMNWLRTGQNFGRSMAQVFLQMAGTMIQQILKASEAHLLALALHKTAATKDIFVSAKEAAGKAMGAAPPPLNIALAAAAFAGTIALASFDKGGIMGETGAAMLHKNEMVLPPHLSSFVQAAATRASEGGETSGGGNFNYSATIHAMDRTGVEDALRQHGDLMFTMWEEHMRRRNY